jgi:MFS family permease
MRRQVRELYSATIILNFAIAMVSIFEPVFLFTLFIKKYDLRLTVSLILLFYLAVYIAYLFCVPLGAKFAKKFGYEISIALGCVFTALFYLCLFGASKYIGLIFVAIILYVLWKMFYWPAYHADFAKFSVDGEQGREVGNLIILEALVYVAGPVVGGMILQFYGFKILFIFAAIIMILSNVPMLVTKENLVPGSFDYKGAFKRLFARENFRRFLPLLGYGEEFVVLVVWPIFMFVVIKDFLSLGVITGLATLITLLVYLYIGKLTDKNGHDALLKLGEIAYCFVWMLRALISSVGGVLLLDTASRLSKQAIAIPITATTYERAQDNSVMEGVTFFEMSLVIGKIIAIILCLILVQLFMPFWGAIFIVAGLMSLLYLLFR